MTALLEVNGLAKRFGELRALDGVGLTVAQRGVHSIIGPNGAGKTTLFNCITGVVKPDAGRVVLAGRDITGLGVVPRVRLGLVRTFQVSRVFGSVSARENVRLALQKTSMKGRLGLRLSLPPGTGSRSSALSCWTRWGSRQPAGISPAGCFRMRTGGRSRWRWRWRANLCCCASTSPPRASASAKRSG